MFTLLPLEKIRPMSTFLISTRIYFFRLVQTGVMSTCLSLAQTGPLSTFSAYRANWTYVYIFNSSVNPAFSTFSDNRANQTYAYLSTAYENDRVRH